MGLVVRQAYLADTRPDFMYLPEIVRLRLENRKGANSNNSSQSD